MPLFISQHRTVGLDASKPSPFTGLILFLASGTYLGYIPWAPGTFGSLWGMLIYFFFSSLTLKVQFNILIGSTLIAVLLAGAAEKTLAPKIPLKW